MTTTTVTCDALLSVSIPGTFGPIRVPCAQRVALRRWVDTSGTEHRACPRHIAEMTHRWPVGDVAPEPVAAETELELAAAFGDW